jgi:hypothetical protein
MTSALRTLTNHDVARGSTLLNILQQIAGSVGGAVMSVILTSELNKSAPVTFPDSQTGQPVTTTEANLAIGAQMNPEMAAQFPDPSLLERGLEFAADSFATTFMVGFVLVLLTLVPALFLPRKREESHLLDEEKGATPVVLH